MGRDPLLVQIYDPTFFVAYDVVLPVTVQGRDDCTVEQVPADLNAAYDKVESLLYGPDSVEYSEDSYPEVGDLFADQLLLNMLRVISILSLVILVVGVALWATGALEGVSAWAADWQRQVQTSMARGLRALRAGEPGALLALLTICFSYGFFHAVGPGHGKVLIGGYSLASRATMWRMSSVALLSSLAQGLSAIVLVFAGVLVLNLTRQQMVGLAEDWFADASYAAIALIGLYLLVRGARKLLRVSRNEAHSHNHGHAPLPRLRPCACARPA